MGSGCGMYCDALPHGGDKAMSLIQDCDSCVVLARVSSVHELPHTRRDYRLSTVITPWKMLLTLSGL